MKSPSTFHRCLTTVCAMLLLNASVPTTVHASNFIDPKSYNITEIVPP